MTDPATRRRVAELREQLIRHNRLYYLENRPEIGLMLPCNVTVEEVDSGARVRFVDPGTVLGGFGGAADPALEELAIEAGNRIGRVAASLAE